MTAAGPFHPAHTPPPARLRWRAGPAARPGWWSPNWAGAGTGGRRGCAGLRFAAPGPAPRAGFHKLPAAALGGPGILLGPPDPAGCTRPGGGHRPLCAPKPGFGLPPWVG